MNKQQMSAKAAKPGYRTSTKWPVALGLCTVLALTSIGGAWAGLTTLSSAVITSGSVVVRGKPKTIQHLDGGIVAAIQVKDGDTVKRGDILVKLDASLLKAQAKIVLSQLQHSVSEKIRLSAERDRAIEILWPSARKLGRITIPLDGAMRRSQDQLFQARRTARLGEVASLREKAAQIENQINGQMGITQTLQKQIALLEQELAGKRKLQADGLVRLSERMRLEQQHVSLLGRVAEARTEKARLLDAKAEVTVQMAQVENRFTTSVLTDLSTVEQRIGELKQKMLSFQQKLNRLHIRAPIAGTVHALNIFTIGAVVTPAEAIAQIVPDSDTLEIEAYIRPQFIDALHVGQQATLRFAQSSQSTAPELSGTLTHISADTMTDPRSGQPGYRILVSSPDEKQSRLQNREILPGMQVDLFLNTGERSPISYLLKPLTDQWERALRES